jgi:ribosomal protein S18 acetylase RimI-like enzyme
MSEPMALSVSKAGPRLASALGARTFPHYRPLLAKVGSDPSVIALALAEGKNVIGLLLGQVTGGIATVLSVSVADRYRRQGGGLALMRAFEQEAAMRGVGRLLVRYTSDRANPSAMLGLVAKAGWSPPAPSSVIYNMDRDASMKAPWMTRAQRRFRSYTVQPWREVERNALQQIGPANWATEELHPREHVGVGQDGALQDLDASAILRLGEGADAPVIGWIIVHTLSESEARVTSGTVHPKHRRHFAFGALVAHANQTLFDAGVQRALFVVRPSEPEMAAFAERWIAPLSASIRESYESAKWLNVATSPRMH